MLSIHTDKNDLVNLPLIGNEISESKSEPVQVFGCFNDSHYMVSNSS